MSGGKLAPITQLYFILQEWLKNFHSSVISIMYCMVTFFVDEDDIGLHRMTSNQCLFHLHEHPYTIKLVNFILSSIHFSL